MLVMIILLINFIILISIISSFSLYVLPLVLLSMGNLLRAHHIKMQGQTFFDWVCSLRTLIPKKNVPNMQFLSVPFMLGTKFFFVYQGP